jgi:hypothetical protein
MEAGDLADFDPFFDDGAKLKDLRAAGVNTEIVKKRKEKRREIPQEDGPPIIEVDREIELHDRAGDDFDRVMDRTVGKPSQAVEVNINAHSSFIFLTPGQERPVGRLALPVVDVTADPQTPPNATFSQMDEKTAQLEPPGGAAESADNSQPDPKLVIGASYIPLLDGTLQDQFVLIESRRGTGKTRAILTVMVARALQHPGSRWLIVRSSRTRLTDSAIATFVDQVLPLFGLPVPACSREQISTYTFPADRGGAQFIFQGLDDPNRQQSVECAGVYVVEGVEIHSIDVITALAASMRQACVPPLPFFQCIVDCNPGAPGHSLNQVAEAAGDDLRIVATKEQYQRVLEHNRAPAPEGKWKRIITHHADNPGYFDVVKWIWTKAGEQYLKTLSFLTGYLRNRWLYGLWSAAEGVVFPEFDESIHVVEDFAPPADWPWFVGWDPGFAHPTGIPWVCVDPLGDLYVGDEIYEGGKSIAQHAETVLKKCVGRTIRRKFGDPHEFFSRRAQGESCAVQASNAGLGTFTPWAAQEKTAMVNAYRQLLQNSVTLAQTGQRKGVCLYVMRRCKNTIMEHQSWAFKKNAKGELPEGDEKYEDANNHLVGDPLVGMVATGQLKYGGGRTETVDNG